MSDSEPHPWSRREFVRRAGGAALAAVLAPAAARSAPSSRPDSPGAPADDTATLPSLAGRFPVVARTSRGKDVYALTPENFYGLHAYFDRSPLDASQRKLAYFRVADRQAGQGEVVLLDLATARETVVDEVRGFNLHIGVNLLWGSDAGRAYYNGTSLRAAPATGSPVMALNVADVASGRNERLFPGWPVLSPQRPEFVAIEDQGQKIVCGGIDGSHRRELATMTQALSLKARPETFADGTRNATHGHPVWTRDDRAVIFNAQPGRNSRIFIMPV